MSTTRTKRSTRQRGRVEESPLARMLEIPEERAKAGAAAKIREERASPTTAPNQLAPKTMAEDSLSLTRITKTTIESQMERIVIMTKRADSSAKLTPTIESLQIRKHQVDRLETAKLEILKHILIIPQTLLLPISRRLIQEERAPEARATKVEINQRAEVNLTRTQRMETKIRN